MTKFVSVLLAGVVSLLLAGEPTSGRDTSGRKKQKGREWFDASGRKIKEIDSAGRVTLITYDEQGRVIRVDGLALRARPSDDHPEADNAAAWTHCFEYAEDGNLVAEFDCVGNRHAAVAGATVDPKRGTSVKTHEHPQPAGSLGEKGQGKMDR